MEHPLKPFSVAELQHSLPTFVVIYEPSLIVDPYFFSLVEIAVVKWIAQFDRILVIKNSIAVQLVTVPLPLVGDATIWVVQGSAAMHKVFFPISTIFSSFIIIECAIPISQTLKFSSFVPTFCKLFFYESGLRHLDW